MILEKLCVNTCTGDGCGHTHSSDPIMSAASAELLFPRDELSHAAAGYLVGWNPHSFMCTLASIESGVSLQALERALRTLATLPSLQPLIAHCGGPPAVIGAWRPAEDGEQVRPPAHADVWLTLCRHGNASSWPSLQEVHCCGCRYRAPLQLILFERGGKPCGDGRGSHFSVLGTYEADGRQVAASQAVSALELSLRHASCSGTFQRALAAVLEGEPVGAEGHARASADALSTQAPPRHARRPVLPRPLCVAVPVLVSLRLAAAGWLWLVRFEPLPKLLPGWSLCCWSASAQRTEACLVRMVEWPHRYVGLRDRPLWQPGAILERMHTYGELACTLLDCALGAALALFISRRWRELCAAAATIQASVHDSWLPGVVEHLMGVDPGGIKLNPNLNVTLGSVVLGMLRVWRDVLVLLLHMLPSSASLLLLVLPGCCLGASVGATIAIDVLTLSCLHLYCLYRATAALYSGYLAALYSLFNLFRGLKYNALRGRVDTCDYDTEQLLLGTLFFTVLVFLFPTVGAYYLLTSSLWLAVLVAKGLLGSLLFVLVDFPWLELAISLLRPTTLHSGVRFRPIAHPNDRGTTSSPTITTPAAAATPPTLPTTPPAATVFALELQPAALAPFFARHRQVATALLEHYTLGYLMRNVLLGREVLPAPGVPKLERPPPHAPPACQGQQRTPNMVQQTRPTPSPPPMAHTVADFCELLLRELGADRAGACTLWERLIRYALTRTLVCSGGELPLWLRD